MASIGLACHGSEMCQCIFIAVARSSGKQVFHDGKLGMKQVKSETKRLPTTQDSLQQAIFWYNDTVPLPKISTCLWLEHGRQCMGSYED